MNSPTIKIRQTNKDNAFLNETYKAKTQIFDNKEPKYKGALNFPGKIESRIAAIQIRKDVIVRVISSFVMLEYIKSYENLIKSKFK